MTENQLTAEDFSKLRNKCLEIGGAVESNRMKMEKKFSDFDPKKDIRISSFGHLLTTINSAILTLTYFCQYLMKKEWWFAYINESYSESTIVKKVNRYSWYGRASLFHFTFSTFESTTRLILRALDSSACKNGTAEFKSIYSCLLRNKIIRVS